MQTLGIGFLIAFGVLGLGWIALLVLWLHWISKPCRILAGCRFRLRCLYLAFLSWACAGDQSDDGTP